MSKPEPDHPISAHADAEMTRQLLEFAFRHQPAGLAVSALAAIGAAFMLSGSAGSGIWLWLGLFLAVCVSRTLLHRSWNTQKSHETPDNDIRKWSLRFDSGVVALALLWGALPIAFMPAQLAAERLATIAILSGMAGGAAAVLAPRRTSARIYLALVLGPPSVMLMLERGPSLILGLLCIVFLAVMELVHRTNHLSLSRSIRLQNENAQLLAHLSMRQHQLESTNSDLEARVVERTAVLEQMASRDYLTGTLSRAWLLQELHHMLLHKQTKHAVLFIDIDRFRHINDGLDHQAGDSILRSVAERFQQVVPEGGVLGRWASDQFIVVIERGNGLTECRRMSYALRNALAAPFVLDTGIIKIDISIGVSVQPQHGNTAAGLIRAADLAMLAAKQGGRAQTRIFRDYMAETQRRKLEIAQALQRAMSIAGALQIFFQPIVSARSGQVLALEALLRWDDSKLGRVGPSEFIPIAEESSRMIALGNWVLKRATELAAHWGGDAPPKVAINVSIKQLVMPDFRSNVSHALAASGLSPERLEIEVTESVFAEDNNSIIRETLHELRAMGISLHLDDFGTGYSSLSRLRDLPFDTIKIDRAFVATIDGDGKSVVQGAILIAKSFGMHVIAEGIETREQAAALLGLGVDAFQGYLTGRPERAATLGSVPPVWLGETVIGN